MGFGGSMKGPGAQGGGAGAPAYYMSGVSVYGGVSFSAGESAPTKPNLGWGGKGGPSTNPWAAGIPGQAGYCLIWWLE